MIFRQGAWAALLGAALLALIVAPLSAGEKPCISACLTRPRPQDQIWLVSTRELDCVDCRLMAPPKPAVWKYDALQCNWQPASVDKLLATDNPETPTNIFVHGNWISFEGSVQEAFTYYLNQASYAPSDRPLRLVIWSWPSTRGRHPVRDVRAKYARTDSEAEYLAWFLGRVSPRVKVSLTGYSFGAPIVTGALHRLALHGGALDRMPVPRVEREVSRVVLIAAAEDRYVLAAGQEHELALSRVELLLNLTNGCDSALKYFRFVDPCARPEALGYHGMAGYLGVHAAKVEQIECSAIVGKQHYWRPFVTDPSLIAEMRPYIWFDDAWPDAMVDLALPARR